MTKQEESELRQLLNNTPKSEIISTFIKLRKMYDRASERLVKVENELENYETLEKVIDSLSDDVI